MEAVETDAETTPNPAPGIPRATAVLGALIVASAAMPLTPSGESFAELVAETLMRDPLEGFMMLIGLGSPFLFGLCAGSAGLIAGRTHGGDRILRRATSTVLALVHTQLILVGIVVTLAGVGVAPYALLGLGVVSGVTLVAMHARARAESRRGDTGPDLRWLLGWGGTIVAGIAAWARLQMIDGLQLGPAVDVLLVAAATLAFVARPKARPSPESRDAPPDPRRRGQN